MATYTSNINLHQWEGTDSFLRTDFNEDFLKIDTALGALTSGVSTVQTASESNAYNIYNLMLQNYYDGKYTSFKSAMIFDGFVDESNIASKTEALVYSTGNNRLVLSSSTLSDVTTSGASGYSSIMTSGYYTPTQTASGNGYITGISFVTESGSSGSTSVTYSVYVNGTAVSSGYDTLTYSTDGSTSTLTLTAAPVAKGDSFYIWAKTSSSATKFGYNSSGNLVGTIYCTSLAATSGYLLSESYTLPESTKMLAWVRHKNGTVALSAGDQFFTALSTASATSLQGDSCTESAFELTPSPDETELAFQIDIDIGSSARCILYDYGIILI